MDELYDMLCAKEKQKMSFIKKCFQTFDEQSDSLIDTRLKKVDTRFELLSQSFHTCTDTLIDDNIKEVRTTSNNIIENKLTNFKKTCDYELEACIENDMLQQIMDSKYEIDIKDKIQQQLLTDLHDGPTAQSCKDKVYNMVLKETQLSMKILKEELSKTLNNEFKASISKLQNNITSHIGSTWLSGRPH